MKLIHVNLRQRINASTNITFITKDVRKCVIVESNTEDICYMSNLNAFKCESDDNPVSRRVGEETLAT